MNQLQPYQKEVLYAEESSYRGMPSGRQDGQDQLEQVIDLLYKGKWIIIGCLVLGLGLAAAYTYTRTPVYETSALVMLEGQSSGQSGNNPAMARFASSQWGRSPSTELMLLQNSKKLPLAVAERLINDVRSTEQAQSFVRPWIVSASGDSLSKQEVASRIQGKMRFASSQNGVLQFKAVSTNPMRAYMLANMFASEYVELTKQTSRAGLSASRDFLEEQLETREQELQSIERQIEEYLSNKGTVSIEQEGAKLSSQVTALRTRRDQLKIELERRKNTVEALEKRLSEIRPGLARSVASTKAQEIERLQQRLGELKAARQEALVKNPDLTRDAPQFQEINRQIQQLDQKVNQLSGEYVNEVMASGSAPGDSLTGSGLSQAAGLKQQIASEQVAITGIETEIQALDRYIKQYQAELKNVPGQSLMISRLRREQERASQMYEYVLQQLQEIRLQEQGELGYASVIAQANRPGAPVRPQSWRHLILGAFFGLGLGMGLSVLRYQFDNKLYKPDDLEAKGYNTTLVPDMRKLIQEKHDGKALVEYAGRDINAGLMTLHNPASSVAEAYRQLRTNLQLSLSDEGAKTIVVTSGGIGEGKTTTSTNLAVAFARAGTRTLLIDGDMRRPQVHRYLGMELEPGLYQLLREKRGFESTDMETGIENLWAITAGASSGEHAAELIASGGMRELLNAARDEFDVIIIDTPPALAVAEAKLLASQANATVLVARAGETKNKELEHTVRELERSGGHIHSVVLNGFNLSMAYNYRYRYRDYSTYGPYSDYTPAEA